METGVNSMILTPHLAIAIMPIGLLVATLPILQEPETPYRYEYRVLDHDTWFENLAKAHPTIISEETLREAGPYVTEYLREQYEAALNELGQQRFHFSSVLPGDCGVAMQRQHDPERPSFWLVRYRVVSWNDLEAPKAKTCELRMEGLGKRGYAYSYTTTGPGEQIWLVFKMMYRG